MIKQIFKRVLVGVGVGIILSLIAKYGLISNVYAMQVYTGNMINANQSNRFTIDSVTSSISYDFDALFHDVALGTSGYIRFPISINKVGGSSTSSIVSIRGVTVKIGDLNYICDVGSTSGNNSTYQFSDYSVMCPVNMSGGLHNVYVAFNDLQTNDNGTYRVTIGTGVSYEKVDNVSVNVDTSNVTSAIGTQISNDNSNTQQIVNSQNNTTDAINDVNDTLNDDDVTDATDSSTDFFENFQVNGHGLSNFITMPFRLIQSFTAQTCTPLQFQLPFVHNVVTIPCFRPIIQQHFPTILALFQLITTGLICYRVCINTFSIVKRLQNPTDDRIEVLDL